MGATPHSQGHRIENVGSLQDVQTGLRQGRSKRGGKAYRGPVALPIAGVEGTLSFQAM